MKPLIWVLAFVFMVGSAVADADNNKKTYHFKQGQVIDFLFLASRPKSEAAFKAYVQAAISEATALGYKNLSSFSITRTPTQGNYYPDVLVFGGWPGDFTDRANALAQLKKAVPDLNARRLDIWSSFNMTNYHLTEDKSFSVSYDKIQVLTAYWQKDAALFAVFKHKFLKNVQQAGGVVKLALMDGRSPFGYEYNPDYTVITEWDNQAAFDTFLAANLEMDHAGVRHVNQLYLTPPARKN